MKWSWVYKLLIYGKYVLLIYFSYVLTGLAQSLSFLSSNKQWRGKKNAKQLNIIIKRSSLLANENAEIFSVSSLFSEHLHLQLLFNKSNVLMNICVSRHSILKTSVEFKRAQSSNTTAIRNLKGANCCNRSRKRAKLLY